MANSNHIPIPLGPKIAQFEIISIISTSQEKKKKKKKSMRGFSVRAFKQTKKCLKLALTSRIFEESQCWNTHGNQKICQSNYKKTHLTSSIKFTPSGNSSSLPASPSSPQDVPTSTSPRNYAPTPHYPTQQHASERQCPTQNYSPTCR